MRTTVAICSVHSVSLFMPGSYMSLWRVSLVFFWWGGVLVSHQLSCFLDKAQQVLRSPTDELKIRTEEQVDGGVEWVRLEHGGGADEGISCGNKNTAEIYTTGVVVFFTLMCDKQRELEYSCRRSHYSQRIKDFLLVIDRRDSCYSRFSAADTSGNFKENIKGKIKQKCHRMQRVGPSRGHLNDIDLFL